MLWKQLVKDEFETDIIEVLREKNQKISETLDGLTREDFSEIYLFFDYDGHQKNLTAEDNKGDVIEEMLQNFDNETENGKLYINYPMVEALRDFEPGICGTADNCYCELSHFEEYKEQSVKGRYYIEVKKYSFEVWREILNVFVARSSCLFQKSGMLSFQEYRNLVTPSTVYESQRELMREKEVFVFSAFPEFLLDYFPEKFWNSCIKCSEKFRSKCKKRK